MSDPTPEQMAGNWNQVARQYAEHIDPTTAPYAADLIELAQVGGGDRLLDVASGSGAATIVAAGRAREVVAADFSSEMCTALRERCEDQGIDNVDVREMDAQALDLPDDEVDVAISSFGAMICPDRNAAFGEMARVTRPRGHLAASAWQAPPNNDWLETFMTTVSRALPDLPPPTPPRFMELADPDHFRSELEAAGWSDVDIVDAAHVAPWTDVDQAWAAIAHSNPIFGPMLEQAPDEMVERLRNTFGEVIADRGDAHLSAGAWLATGTA